MSDARQGVPVTGRLDGSSRGQRDGAVGDRLVRLDAG